MDGKLTNNFYLFEFVSKPIYEKYGNNSIWFIDERIPTLCQCIRDDLGKRITVNTWKFSSKKIYSQSGFRERSSTVGSSLSQHRFGRAADIKVDNMSSEEVREYIRSHFESLSLIGLSTIEKDTQGWVHFDMRPIKSHQLFEVPYVRHF